MLHDSSLSVSPRRVKNVGECTAEPTVGMRNSNPTRDEGRNIGEEQDERYEHHINIRPTNVSTGESRVSSRLTSMSAGSAISGDSVLAHSYRPTPPYSILSNSALSFDEYQTNSKFNTSQQTRIQHSNSIPDAPTFDPTLNATIAPSRFTFPRSAYGHDSRSMDASRATTAENTPQQSRRPSISTPLETAPPATEKKIRSKPTALTAGATDTVTEHVHTSIGACIAQATFGGAIYGYNTAIIAGLSGPMVDRFFFPSSSGVFRASMTGILVACILLGGFIGTIISLPLTNRWGRRVSMGICGIICCIGCAAMVFVENFIGLVLIRTFLGISVGMTTTICPLYSAECSPVNKRGSVGSVYQVALVSGILVAQIVNYTMNPSNSPTLSPWKWQVQFALGAFFGAGLILMAAIAPESPIWLAHRAKRRLKEIATMEQKHGVLARRGSHTDQQQDALTQPRPTAPKLKGWTGLFHRSNLHWLALAILLPAANQLTGINAVIYYAPRIFQDAGFTTKALVLAIAVVGSWNLVSVAISVPLISAISRRRLMIIAQTIMSLGLLLITLAFALFPAQRAVPSIVAILLVVFGFEIGPGPLFFVLAAEVFPITILHAGLSFANSAAWICNIAITFLFPVLTQAAGAAGMFGIFLVLSILSIIGYLRLLPSDVEKRVITESAMSSDEPISALDEGEEDKENSYSNPEPRRPTRPTVRTTNSNELELVIAPVPIERKEVNDSPPYPARDQNQEWKKETATPVVKHPLQSPLYQP